jgi:hypothetical protein
LLLCDMIHPAEKRVFGRGLCRKRRLMQTSQNQQRDRRMFRRGNNMTILPGKGSEFPYNLG